MTIGGYIPLHISMYFTVKPYPPIGYQIFNNFFCSLYLYFLYMSYKKDLNYIFQMSWLLLMMDSVFLYNFWNERELGSFKNEFT